MYDLGVRIFTDDGDCVADASVMRWAFEYASALPGAVLAQHAEDPSLVRGGHMHEGAWSAQLGIPGRPAVAESTIVARDLAARRADGWPVPRAAPFVRGVGRPRAHGQGAGSARDCRVHAPAPRAHRRVVCELRPRLQDEPAAARAGRRRRPAARVVRRHDRRDRDRPRAARARDEGSAVRGGAAGHARSGDRARRRAHDAGRTGRLHAGATRSARCRGGRPRSPASPRPVRAARSRRAGPRTCA